MILGVVNGKKMLLNNFSPPPPEKKPFKNNFRHLGVIPKTIFFSFIIVLVQKRYLGHLVWL